MKKKKKKKKNNNNNNNNKANLTYLSHCGEEDEWLWRGQVIHWRSLFVRERKKERESSSLDEVVREKRKRERKRALVCFGVWRKW